MPSSWIVPRASAGDSKRYLVRYRLGGRESQQRHAGSFRTRAEALARKRWVDGELAAMRIPEPRSLDAPAPGARTLLRVAEAWRASRVDVAPGTAQTYGVAINRLRERMGDVSLDTIDAAKVAELVATL